MKKATETPADSITGDVISWMDECVERSK